MAAARDGEARLVDLAGQRAELLLRTAEAGTTPAERRRSRRLGRILADPTARELVVSLTDEVLRSPDRRRAMRRYRALTDGKLPRGFGPVDRVGLRLASVGAAAAPRAVGWVVTARVLRETRGVILPAEDPAFARHVARRRAEGMDVNVNLLGEAILGDDEAAARFRDIGLRLARPDVDCVSVKISALCANLDVLAFGHSVERIVARLRPLLRLAASSTPPKLVNLDMEEHRDLELTLAAFRQVLEEPELVHLPAGVALQAYLPDSHAALDELIAWARRRRAAGGAWTRVRLVKGANLGMEQVEAELAGWPPAPYPSKPDVDASFKRMLDAALDAAAAGDLRVGVASHNLFDVAWALTLRDERGLQESVEVEMLEGMAPAQARAARDDAGSLLLYTPVVAATDVAASIAYLSRRLDENAAEGNFLRSLFSITPGSPAWRQRARRASRHAVAHRHDVTTTPRQTQDRSVERRSFGPDDPFANEPDTDFTVAANRAWIEAHLATSPPLARPPLVGDLAAIDAVVERARRGASAWAETSTAERRQYLARAAEVMAAARGRTLAVMARETDKTVREGDPEVSEGIDMARWAATSTHTLDELASDGVACVPLGVVLVAGPWNFPYAIPANGVVGAIAAGNAVILKPAPEAVATAAELVRQLHEAGIPDDVVQLVRCPDDEVGRHLVTHEGVDAVVLTGSYDTARLFLDWKPSLRLLAETSGKNAMVITGAADVDLAIKDLVRSAFGHAGQKCSAASLAIVEAGVHDDPHFQARLADAVRSLRIGPATDLATMVGPVIHPPEGPLPARPHPTRRGRAMAGGAEAHRRRRPAVDAGRASRGAAGFVVPPDRVLRAGAGRPAGRRPRPRHRAAERHRLRADGRPPEPRSGRDRALARARGGGQRVRQPAHDGGHRPPSAVRRLEALVGGAGCQGRRARRHPSLRPAHGHRPARGRDGVVPALVAGAVRHRARRRRPGLRGQRAAIPGRAGRRRAGDRRDHDRGALPPSTGGGAHGGAGVGVGSAGDRRRARGPSGGLRRRTPADPRPHRRRAGRSVSPGRCGDRRHAGHGPRSHRAALLAP